MSSSVTVVPVLLVSPSIVSGFGETLFSDTDCEFVESQTFALSRSVTRLLLKVKTRCISAEHWRKRLQHPGRRFAGSNTEVNMGGLHETTVIEKMKHYLDRSESLEVDMEELEYYLLGPNDLDVDIRFLAQGFSTRLARKEQATSL